MNFYFAKWTLCIFFSWVQDRFLSDRYKNLFCTILVNFIFILVSGDSEKSLIIAVCILGTLVAVTIFLALASLIYSRCCNQKQYLRRWARRRAVTRERLGMAELAAGSNCHFTSDLLPSNRTGASENLGIRSPNPQQVPALRCPADFSPSPPFPCEAMKNGQNLCGRERMPTPPRHFMTNSRTKISFSNQNSSDSDSDYCTTNTVKRKGEYAQLPSCSPRPKKHSCCLKEKMTSRFSDNLYPASSKESMTADEEYHGRRHSGYFHQSRHTSNHSRSQAATHGLDNKKRPRCSGARSALRNSYEDVCCRNKSSNSSKLKQSRCHHCDNERSVVELKSKHDAYYCKDRGQSRKSIIQRELVEERETCRESNPLASSSRNTSMEYFNSLPVRKKYTEPRFKTDAYSDSKVNFQSSWEREKQQLVRICKYVLDFCLANDFR